MTPEVDAMADARCEAIACSIGHVKEFEDLEVESAVVNLTVDGGGKRGYLKRNLHAFWM